jgi:predicted nucleic acid-binding protein
LKGFLADTNIPSELTRPNPDPRVAAFLVEAGREQVYLSALSLGEMRKGVAALTRRFLVFYFAAKTWNISSVSNSSSATGVSA